MTERVYCGHCWQCVDYHPKSPYQRGKPYRHLGVIITGYPGMMLCPQCGNKRCPHASDHELVCTGSNEPGQKGSRYA